MIVCSSSIIGPLSQLMSQEYQGMGFVLLYCIDVLLYFHSDGFSCQL